MKKVRHKFNAVRTENDGFTFSSKAEAKFYNKLKIMQKAGEVLFFLMQVPFHLPGKVKYVVDFVIFYADGEIEFVDVKGMMTPTFISKKKMVESVYPVNIKVEYTGKKRLS